MICRARLLWVSCGSPCRSTRGNFGLGRWTRRPSADGLRGHQQSVDSGVRCVDAAL